MSNEELAGINGSPITTTEVIDQIDGLPHGEQLHTVAILCKMATGWNGDLGVPRRIGLEARGHNLRPRSNARGNNGSGRPVPEQHCGASIRVVDRTSKSFHARE